MSLISQGFSLCFWLSKVCFNPGCMEQVVRYRGADLYIQRKYLCMYMRCIHTAYIYGVHTRRIFTAYIEIRQILRRILYTH